MAKLSTQVIKETISKKFNCAEKDIKRASKKKNANKQVERVFQVNKQKQTIVVTSDEGDESIISLVERLDSEIAAEIVPTPAAAVPQPVVLNALQQHVVDVFIANRLKSSFKLNQNQATQVKCVLDERGNVECVFHVPQTPVGECYLTATVNNHGEIVGCSQLSPAQYRRAYINPPKVKTESQFSDYYFAISTQRIERAGFSGYYLVSIISKEFWDENHYTDDQPSPLMYTLPAFIDDLNETSEMGAYVENWQEAYAGLIDLGIEYNNELAQFLNGFYPGMHIQP